MGRLPGVFTAKKKDGTEYFRSSFTFQGKHISLGSYSSEVEAANAYLEAQRICQNPEIDIEHYHASNTLAFEKWVTLINYRDNRMYCKTPIYILKNYFLYYFGPDDYLKFDADDLFYYSKHTIQRRGGHLFVAEYGTQFNILARYGIKNFAVVNRDYRFVNGDPTDFRYRNIEVINKYHGVCKQYDRGIISYTAKIHINGDWQIGTYSTEAEAAVAYNKAATILTEQGVQKNFPKNFVLELNEIEYAALYNRISISKSLRTYSENRNL